MSFLVAAALAVGFLVVAPLVAHLLRRGRAEEQAFPPARLVPVARSVARQRARIEDRLLFALRALQIALLAVLGATPLVRCARLSLSRDGGASVALAIVLDDSLSMRAKLPDGGTRWEKARSAALELARSGRRGDAVAIVLGGRPARVALAATTDLDAVKRALADLSVSDRSTDLASAVQLARGLLSDLPQRDRQLVLLSDLAGEKPPPGTPEPWTPLGDIAQPVDDCGVAAAERKASHIEAVVVCTNARAATARSLEAFAADPLLEATSTLGPALGTAPFVVRGGLQIVSIKVPPDREVLGVRATGSDAIERNDAASVARESVALAVAVHADPTRASATTGGPTLIEQALGALGHSVAVRPVAILPEDPNELNRVSAIVLDDPGGLGPEVRSALEAWVRRGGVALALLGPRAERREIGSTLEPFAQGALPWEETRAKGLNARTLEWLGPEAEGLAELRPRGRSRLEGSDLPGARVVGRWSDEAPFLFERDIGRGQVLTLGMPSSPDESDLALRPGFLALLDHVISLARDRSGQRRSQPGLAWRFPVGSQVEVNGPSGRLLPSESDARSAGAPKYLLFTPELAGRYRVRTSEGVEERAVALDPEEIGLAPRRDIGTAQSGSRSASAPEVDASPEFVWALVMLLGLEALFRAARLFRSSRRPALQPGRP